MNIVLFEESELGDCSSEVVVVGRRAEHLLGVVRVSVGDPLRVGIFEGKIGSALVKVVADDHLIVGNFNFTKEPISPWVDVILAAPRPRMLNRVLQGLSSMGARRILIVRSEKVEKSFLHSPLLKEEKLNHITELGLEQGGLTIRPEVHIYDCPRRFFSADLPSLYESSQRKICAHPRAVAGLSDLEGSFGAAGVDACPLVALGPEGGWTEKELELFKKNGFHLVNVGERILRVEVAVPYILAQLQLLLTLSKKP